MAELTEVIFLLCTIILIVIFFLKIYNLLKVGDLYDLGIALVLFFASFIAFMLNLVTIMYVLDDTYLHTIFLLQSYILFPFQIPFIASEIMLAIGKKFKKIEDETSNYKDG